MWDLQSFHRRPAHEMQNVARDRDDVFEELMTTYNCQFGFMKRHEDPRDSDPCPVGVHGLTYANDFDPRLGEIPQFFVNLCIEDLEPLLANVNSSERMCVEWFIAETVSRSSISSMSTQLTSCLLLACSWNYALGVFKMGLASSARGRNVFRGRAIDGKWI